MALLSVARGRVSRVTEVRELDLDRERARARRPRQVQPCGTPLHSEHSLVRACLRVIPWILHSVTLRVPYSTTAQHLLSYSGALSVWCAARCYGLP